MIFPNDLPPHHPYFQFRRQLKGMRVILEEWGILAHIIAQNCVKVLPGDCANCKMSQHSQDKAAHERAAATSESFYSETNTDDKDSPSLDAYLPTSTCCMWQIMSLQKVSVLRSLCYQGSWTQVLFLAEIWLWTKSYWNVLGLGEDAYIVSLEYL